MRCSAPGRAHAARDHARLSRCARIGYQARPRIFAKNIIKPEQLYSGVVEVDERVLADGTVEAAPDPDRVRAALAEARAQGYDAVAIVFMHAYRYPAHERLVAEIARKLGLGKSPKAMSPRRYQARFAWRHDRGRRLSFADSRALCQPGVARSRP